MPHTPVLLQEVLDYLNLASGKIVVDGTINGGGHASEILKRISPGGVLLGLDWDADVLEGTRNRLEAVGKSGIILENSNYRDVRRVMSGSGISKADGLLLDLGFSSNQLTDGRGFSFVKDEPLRMTYAKDEKSVAELLRTLSESDLANVIYEFGEERYSRRIARGIKTVLRNGGKILTTLELAGIVEESVPAAYRRGRIHPATRTFQALRIYANRELENLKSILSELPEILNPGGRAVIISFHSLEDAAVKQSFKEYAKSGVGKILTKKPIVPDRGEVIDNPRSRSAKLRVLEIINNTDQKI